MFWVRYILETKVGVEKANTDMRHTRGKDEILLRVSGHAEIVQGAALYVS